MNKRQRKKNHKNEEIFIASFVSSYKELKRVDRARHEYEVATRKAIRFWDMYLYDRKDFYRIFLTQDDAIKYCEENNRAYSFLKRY